MRLLKIGLGMFCFTLFSAVILAADIPDDVEGTQAIDSVECVGNNTDICINSACLTSEDVDCEDNCQKMAEEKCAEQNAE